jgi:hypothetical protein
MRGRLRDALATSGRFDSRGEPDFVALRNGSRQMIL